MQLGLRPSALPSHYRGLGEIHFPAESVEAVKWLMAEWKALSTSPWPLTLWEHLVAPLAACLTTFPRRKSAAVLRRTRRGRGRSRDVRLSWRNPSEGRPHWVERSQTTTNLLITAGQSRFVKAKVVASRFNASSAFRLCVSECERKASHISALLFFLAFLFLLFPDACHMGKAMVQTNLKHCPSVIVWSRLWDKADQKKGILIYKLSFNNLIKHS